MSGVEELPAAAENLAGWHEASLRALGRQSARETALWWGDPSAPANYYTAITLDSVDFATEQTALISRRAAEQPRERLTVCDCFGRLDLAPAGFRLCEEQPWLVRLPAEPRRSAFPAGLEIRRVATAELLEDWEAARTALPDEALTGREPAMGGVDIGEPGLQVFAGSVGGRVVAGSIALIGERAVGVYGVWTAPEHRRRGIGEWLAWRAILGRPQLPAILQPSASSRSLFVRMGFEEIGAFRTWERPAAP